MLPDLNRLKVFHVVYQHRNIQRASEELHVTRSAVSQTLKALEVELETDLFVRNPRNITPTVAANHLFEVIDPFVNHLSETLAAFNLEKREPFGTLNIGAPLDFASTKIIEIAAKFKSRYPNVRFNIQIGIPPKLLDATSKNKLNLSFVDNFDQFDGKYPVKGELITQETFVLACSQRYAKHNLSKTPTYSELSQCAFIGYVPHTPVIKMWFTHHYGKAPTKINCGLSIESVHGVFNAIDRHQGLGVVPLERFQKELEGPSFKIVARKKSPFINKIFAVYLDGKHLTLTEKSFLDFARDQLNQP